jgi:hypothetical protein
MAPKSGGSRAATDRVPTSLPAGTSPKIRALQKQNSGDDYELRDEYDFSKMSIVAKGRYAPERRAGKNVVLLAPDVAQAFPSDDAVNEALRLVLQIAEVPTKYELHAAES